MPIVRSAGWSTIRRDKLKRGKTFQGSVAENVRLKRVDVYEL